MWKSLGQPYGEQRLEVGGRQMSKVEYLMGAALGVIVIGALVLTIMTVMRGTNDTFNEPDPIKRFKCGQCGHEFDVDLKKEMEQLYSDGQMPPPPDPTLAPMPRDCPSCGAKQSCVAMQHCPKCGEYYVNQNSYLFDYSRMPPTGPVPNVCPKCGTNEAQYLAEQYRKKNR